MRRILTLVLALALFSVCNLNAEAAQKSAKPCPKCGKYHITQSYNHHHRAKKKTFLGKLWEAEQRKNAWLKRTFLGM